jgi:hypothetical protein
MTRPTLIGLLTIATASVALAEAPLPTGFPAANATQAEKQAYVLRRMLDEFRDTPSAAGEIGDRVAQMSPARIDQLLNVYRKRAQIHREVAQQEARLKLARSPAYQDHLRRQLYARRAAAPAGGRPVGYAPVITTLPEGAMLGASAVVSPDRRYVRIGVQPFFSHVDRVDTFNIYNGRSRTIYRNPNKPW